MGKRIGITELTASGLGTGFLPIAPGTWGSLLAVLCVALLHFLVPALETPVIWMLTVAAVVVGVTVATRVSYSIGQEDPSVVVIDEIAGQFLALACFPVTVTNLVLGFLIFRVFDILKPFPARQSERLPAGWGIMMDDLIAGVYTALLLYVIRLFWG